ncbi:hypothetical protein [Allorhodopirellula solitaria]|nr:hypothetical protein [Allorhodopirellula solitaria]
MKLSIPQLLGYLWAAPNTLLGIAIGLLLGGRFQRVDGVLEVHGRHVARVLARMIVPAAALTMGHVVFGRDLEALARTRNHERVHVHQYAIWGPFFLPTYLGVSLWLYARGRDGYRDNPFEIQAYAIDDPGCPQSPRPQARSDDGLD